MLFLSASFMFKLSCSPDLRAFEDEAKARLGVVECAKHELLQPFSVLNDKEGMSRALSPPAQCLDAWPFPLSCSDSLVLSLSGECVAQFKFTVLLMANGPHRITNGPFEPELYKSEHEVQDAELMVRPPAYTHSTFRTAGMHKGRNLLIK